MARFSTWLMILLGCLVSVAIGQPSVDTVVTYSQSSSQSVHTITGITIAGQDRGLALCIVHEGFGLDENVTTVQLNGQTFTLVAVSGEQVGSGFYAGMFYLPGPALGSASISYTITDAMPSTAVLMQLSGVKQSLPVLSDESTCDDCDPPGVVSVDLTSTVNNTLFLSCAHSNQDVHTHDQGGAQVELAEFSATFGNRWTISASRYLAVTTGINNINTTANDGVFATDNMEYAVIGIEPPPGASPVRRRASPVYLGGR